MPSAPSSARTRRTRTRTRLPSRACPRRARLAQDEPTNHLDLDAVLWLSDHLAHRWKGTVLAVSHDLDFLSEVCTDLVHLDAAKLHHFGGSIDRFGEMRRQLEAKKQKDYALQQKTLKELKQKGGGLSNEKAVKQMLSKLQMPTLLERPREYQVKFALQSPDDGDGAVSVQDVHFGYAKRSLFRGVSFRLDGSSRVALVGANGSGKTTLARLIAGALEPSAGEVAQTRRLRLGQYHQHFDELLPAGLSPVEYLRSAYELDEQEARKSLGMFGLDGARHLIKIGELSGGQKARVVFASLALKRPHVLLLDEPTNHLDLESVEALIDGLKAFTGGVLLISHDARLISALECELWVCGEGETGVRVERRGFDRYRSDILKAVEQRAQEAAQAAEERAARQRAARMERLRQRKQQRGGKPAEG